MRKAKVIQVKNKTIGLECPRHDIPYTMEASSDPVNEGSWKHYFCKLCRQEKTASEKAYELIHKNSLVKEAIERG